MVTGGCGKAQGGTEERFLKASSGDNKYEYKPVNWKTKT